MAESGSGASAGPGSENTVRELERILRYWGGNLRHYELKPGDGSVIYDSGYGEVGAWRVTSPDGSEDADGPEGAAATAEPE
ncbi:hypothetical protein ETD83_18250 [Actinomadura soli]|uniref:Uncharacterized protein n=1 Tax=Actinomadura soli TaxID=2508997 RepID=A0A5C4JD40_9ACTN|nr:hypothetical protein ETD83_18250 [Actinomadura soli]